MAFNTNVGKQQFTATAGQTVFTFNFAIFQDTNLKVYLTPSGNTADDTADILELSTNYTVVINGTVGGTVTLLVGASINDTVTIVRVLPVARDTDYVTNGDLYADTLDADQDYQTYLVQDGFVQLERAIIIPESSIGVDLNIPAPVANSYLRWNVTANALENDTAIPSAVVTTTNNVALTNADVVTSTAQAVIATDKAAEAAASAASIDNATFVRKDSATGAAYLPAGTTAQRPVAPVNGYMRYNSDLLAMEAYTNGVWGSVGGGATGGGTDKIFNLNTQTVTTNYTIPTGQNAGSFGTITIADGVTVTIPDNTSWTIV